MSKKALLLFMLPVLFLACGEGVFDEEGLAPGQTALEQFTRASQLYYRGRLTASLEEFNGVIYRYPDSPFISDARLAVRRIESELAGELSAQGSSHAMPELDLRIAVIGRPAVSGNVGTASDLLRGTGASITELTDHQRRRSQWFSMPGDSRSRHPLWPIPWTAGWPGLKPSAQDTARNSSKRWLQGPMCW